MIDLLIKKAALLNNVVQKYPNIQQLDKGSLNKLFFSAYQEVISEKENTSFRIMKDCADNCCKSYVNSISDCDGNLLIGTSVILSSVAVEVFTGNFGVVIAALTIGMGGINLEHLRCTNAAARDYKLCKGYN